MEQNRAFVFKIVSFVVFLLLYSVDLFLMIRYSSAPHPSGGTTSHRMVLVRIINKTSFSTYEVHASSPYDMVPSCSDL